LGSPEANSTCDLIGVTGSGTDGRMPEDPEAQFRNAFGTIGLVLREAGLPAGGRDGEPPCRPARHFDLFDAARLAPVEAPTRPGQRSRRPASGARGRDHRDPGDRES